LSNGCRDLIPNRQPASRVPGGADEPTRSGKQTMRLTTKGRFAVTAMIDVAMNSTKNPTTLAAVSERQAISLSYLEQLFGKLRRHGLVASVRGPGGGYRLALAAESVSVADIIIAVDEPIDATQCGGRENCHDDRRCMTHDLWTSLNAHIFDFLHSVTLAELVRQQQKAGVVVMQDHRQSTAGEVRATTVAAA
jgi:Rrf2 family iron-sulfur cluster assembly transcriptional regulator